MQNPTILQVPDLWVLDLYVSPRPLSPWRHEKFGNVDASAFASATPYLYDPDPDNIPDGIIPYFSTTITVQIGGMYRYNCQVLACLIRGNRVSYKVLDNVGAYFFLLLPALFTSIPLLSSRTIRTMSNIVVTMTVVIIDHLILTILKLAVATPAAITEVNIQFIETMFTDLTLNTNMTTTMTPRATTITLLHHGLFIPVDLCFSLVTRYSSLLINVWTMCQTCWESNPTPSKSLHDWYVTIRHLKKLPKHWLYPMRLISADDPCFTQPYHSPEVRKRKHTKLTL